MWVSVRHNQNFSAESFRSIFIIKIKQATQAKKNKAGEKPNYKGFYYDDTIEEKEKK